MKRIKFVLVLAAISLAGCSMIISQITPNPSKSLELTPSATPFPIETLENTSVPTPLPTMPPLQVNNFYGIPYDSPEWLIIPIGRNDNKTAFNILFSGTDMNCTLTINMKTDFAGLSEQKNVVVLGSHTWNILKTYQGDQQIDEIYYPDIYPQEYREGGGVDGNGYSITGFYDSCRSSIQGILSRMP